MSCYWRSEHNKSSINLIKSEIVVKMIYTCMCKDFHIFVLKEKRILEATKSKSMVLNLDDEKSDKLKF
jgi:hypothetical protein